MPKVSIGGKRRYIPSFSMNNNQKLPRATKQVQYPSNNNSDDNSDNGNATPKGGVALSDFEKMTDDEKADVITDALKTGVPLHLDRSGLQRFAYYTGMNEKPDVLDESKWQKLTGQKIYRSVQDIYQRTKDIAYTSSDIAKQIMTGTYTNYSDVGGSYHGNAIYFGTSKGQYGSGKGYAIIRAKVKSSAKIGDEYSLASQMRSELRQGTKLAKAISKANSDSQLSLYAVAKGYDGIKDSSTGYYMIYNRRALAISKKLG